jgi:hypothetical protein
VYTFVLAHVQHVAYAHELKQRLDDLSKEHQLLRSAIALLNGEHGDNLAEGKQ